MKKALIIIGAIIALLLIIAALLPSSVHVERKIEIEAPIDVVFDQVNDLKKNFNWSPWSDYDPDMNIEWGEITSGVGASYNWSGNSDVGTGSLTIAESIENEFIKNNLDFGGMIGQGTWKFSQVYVENDEGELHPGDVEVIWGIDSELDWPINRFFGLFMDGMVGKDFEKGLKNLKDIAESMPVMPKITVEEVEVTKMTLLTIKDSCSIKDIGLKMGEMMTELNEFMVQNEIESSSAPLCIYHVWNEKEGYTVMEAGLPISEDAEIELSGRVVINTLNTGRAAKVVHYGSYETMNASHYAIDEWITENGKQIVGPPWEVYLAYPYNETDTSKWITEIYYLFL